MPHVQEAPSSRLALIGLRLSDWLERWFPDVFPLALLAVAIVFTATLAVGSTPLQSAQWFGTGFWDLAAFTMQMSMITERDKHRWELDPTSSDDWEDR